jgi:signal transduction histidine kinase
MEQTNLLCLDSNPTFLGLFDFSIAPSFLYYSYIPIMLLLLFMGTWIYSSGKKKLTNQLFFGFTIVYVVTLINEIILWTASSVSVVHFGWQMIAPLKFFAALLFFTFALSFIEKKDLSNKQKIILFVLSLPVFALIPTTFNISYFDYEYCEGVNGYLRYYIYFIEFYFLSMIMYLGYKRSNKEHRGVAVFTVTASIMLAILMFANIIGDQTLLYEVDIAGPFGILLFAAGLTFTIVKYKTFDIKLLGVQGLVFVLAFLSFAALFIRSIANIKIVLLVNLVATIVVGHFLVKSVKIVERQRQLLEKANQNQESLLHFITHQVKGYMTKSRNIFDGLLAGDYGPLQDEKMKEIVKYGFDSETKGVETVQSILRASDLKTGRTEFKKERTNLSKLVAELSERAKEAALKKGLDFTFEIEPNIEAMVDPLRIGEVFKNLMDNAVIYTIKGQVHVILKRDADSQIKFAVIDTGFGLTAEDKAKLFTEGGKGTDSIDVNIDSTGYGLFIAKKIVDQHDGKIGAHSDGRDKGSEFFVILPKMQ